MSHIQDFTIELLTNRESTSTRELRCTKVEAEDEAADWLKLEFDTGEHSHVECRVYRADESSPCATMARQRC